jgi:transcriptional regulator CtsR
MEEYRAIHHARYLQREERIQQFDIIKDQLWYNINTKTNDIRCYTVNQQIYDSVKSLIDDFTAIIKYLEDKAVLSQLGMDLLDAINTNHNAKTDFSNPAQVELSRGIKENVTKILSICNIIMDTEELDINYEMDCSQDEILATELQQQLYVNDIPIPIPQRIRRQN